jgi:methionyl-tRNA synthetase
MHSMVIADVAKRYKHLKHAGSVKTLLSTGTDEHGMKVEPLTLWLTDRYNKQPKQEVKIL